LAENDTEMKQYLEILLGDEELCHRLGNNARMTMLDKCSEDRFISEWKQVFDMASKVIFRG
jgi:hypothetical protein